jgi:phosphatidylserine/phosphatidylglycerophosphate/cardiolipin synthase-like enzyme
MRKLLRYFLLFLLLAVAVKNAEAADTLCDPSFQDCRSPLIQLIRAETVGIDVSFWFMEDARYTAELQRRHAAGVKVRVIIDTDANAQYPMNADRLAELRNAGIPMRRKTSGGILHWKMMLFAQQNKVQFSAANYSDEAFVPATPYVAYVDEVIYFTDDPSVVNTFKTKFDNLWVSGSPFENYANITGTPTREYPVFTSDPELNWPPSQSFANRSVNAYKAETQGIDAIIFRITDRRHTDALIAARARGLPIRMITEPQQYRDPTRAWHSWNVDRLYMAGVQIRHRAHQGILHQKSTIFYGQGMVYFGSSNWTSPSSDSQHEHNYFTKKANFLTWFRDQFERKWNNSTGNVETKDFVPLPPGKPSYKSPADGATGLTVPVTLRWDGGLWAHKYDVLLGTSPTSLAPVATDLPLGPSETSTQIKSYSLSNLQTGTTYYYRIVSKTMANQAALGAVRSFTTGGTAGPPPVNGTLGTGDILLYASKASKTGTFRPVADSTAAGASAMHQPDAGAAKITGALANPTNYFELTFNATAGVGYRLWMRMKAQSNSGANDSVHVQFSGSVGSGGSATYRIGTTSKTEVNLEDCSGCGLAGWGWQDNGWGVNVLGPLIYFNTTGPQTIRVQQREDGVSIDQILLSPQKFVSAPPGALKNDTTIYPESGGGSPPPPPPLPSGGEVVLWASKATPRAGNWTIASGARAAGGSMLRNADFGATVAAGSSTLANPPDYFEMIFYAAAGKPYRLWMRMNAWHNSPSNDSLHVQFSGSVNSGGTPIFRIGTTSSTEVNLEDCNGCGLAAWGWQDNGFGTGALGPPIYFESSGTHKIRVSTREDGLYVDQIILSPQQFLNTSPGALKDDATIHPERDGS